MRGGLLGRAGGDVVKPHPPAPLPTAVERGSPLGACAMERGNLLKACAMEREARWILPR